MGFIPCDRGWIGLAANQLLTSAAEALPKGRRLNLVSTQFYLISTPS